MQTNKLSVHTTVYWLESKLFNISLFSSTLTNQGHLTGENIWFNETDSRMKNFTIALISFVLGATIAGAIAFKFLMEFSYNTILGHVTDNLFYYEQLEQGNPERVKNTISGSLSWYILMIEDGNESF